MEMGRRTAIDGCIMQIVSARKNKSKILPCRLVKIKAVKRYVFITASISSLPLFLYRFIVKKVIQHQLQSGS